jgi:hypothetical protein
VRLTFWTAPPSAAERVREIGRTRWWRRRWSRALRHMQEIVESGEAVPRTEVAGGDRLPVT